MDLTRFQLIPSFLVVRVSPFVQSKWDKKKLQVDMKREREKSRMFQDNDDNDFDDIVTLRHLLALHCCLSFPF